MEVYLDNSSTTRMYDECIDKMSDAMRFNYGNPSSLHRKGIEAEKLLRYAKEAISDTLRVTPGEIFFTSGGTESDNWAISGVCAANRGRHILSSAIEHPAVLMSIDTMEDKGYTAERIPVLASGEADVEAFSKMVRSDTVLVTVMLVNNETGAIQPVAEMARIYKAKNPRGVFHVDAVQAYGKIPFTAKDTVADIITLSSHKIHGPKGVGALYIKKGTHISPMIYGGGQQKNFRPGTENSHGIYGFGLAAEKAVSGVVQNEKKMRTLRQRLENGIRENIDNIRINTPKNSAPHILSVSFGGTKAEVLLHSLESEGIYVSSGSACSSHKKGPSYVLSAMKVPRNMIDGTLRFSLSEFTTEEEIDYTVAALIKVVKRNRLVMRAH